MSQEFNDARAQFNEFKDRFYNYLNQPDKWRTWNEYVAKELSNQKYNREFFVEAFLRALYSKLTYNLLEKYPYLEPFTKRSNTVSYITDNITPTKLRMELFNISENELYYPNIRRVMNCHSALNSLVMFIKEKDNPNYLRQQLVLYLRSLLAHPCDKEYTRYYVSLFDYPIIVLTREENLSWFLMLNGPPIIDALWCMREFKLIPARLFLKEYFYPWQFKLTKQELINYCITNNIQLPSTKELTRKELIELIESWQGPKPNKTQYQFDTTKYQLYKFNPIKKEWAQLDTITNEFPEYVYLKDEETWLKTDKKVRVNNIIHIIGINKYQSPKLRLMNPNIHYSALSERNKSFYVYEYFPLYDETIEQMRSILQKASKKIEPSPFETEYGLFYEKEERIGCLLCPYRRASYYEHLMKTNPWAYFYYESLKLIASAMYMFS